MNMKNLIVLLISFLQVSCDFQVSEEFKPAYKPQITVNALFTENQEWQVFVSKNVPAWIQNNHLSATNTDHFIKDAKVLLYENGTLRATLPYEERQIQVYNYAINPNSIPCYTLPSLFPRSKQKYSIKVMADGLSTVEAEGQIPAPISIGDISYRKEATQIDGFPLYHVTFSFKDDPTENNYYMLKVVSEEEHKGSFREIAISSIRTDDSVLKSGLNFWERNQFDTEAGGVRYAFLAFPDDLFRGGGTSVSFSVQGSSFANEVKPARQRILLYTMEESMYQYFSTSLRQELYSSDIFLGILPIESNIKNGLGIFAGYQVASFVIE